VQFENNNVKINKLHSESPCICKMVHSREEGRLSKCEGRGVEFQVTCSDLSSRVTRTYLIQEWRQLKKKHMVKDMALGLVKIYSARYSNEANVQSEFKNGGEKGESKSITEHKPR
jgi:hypothetical protein